MEIILEFKTRSVLKLDHCLNFNVARITWSFLFLCFLLFPKIIWVKKNSGRVWTGMSKSYVKLQNYWVSFHFQPIGRIRKQILPLTWMNQKKEEKNVWETAVFNRLDINQWKTATFEKWETIKVSPNIIPLTVLRGFPSCSTERKK